MDYIQEDVDAMQNELQLWHSENKQHAEALEKEQRSAGAGPCRRRGGGGALQKGQRWGGGALQKEQRSVGAGRRKPRGTPPKKPPPFPKKYFPSAFVLHRARLCSS